MIRFLWQLLVVLAPIGAFAWWALGPVQTHLYHGSASVGILLLLAGLGVLTLVEGLLFKLWLLPSWAHSLSIRFSSGSYVPADDPLVQLVQSLSREPDPARLQQLIRLVGADPHRVRGWLELARVLEEAFQDAPAAVDKLLLGAQTVRNQEDAALLMWRAATLCERHASLADRAQPLLADIARQFPDTNYGRLAASRARG